jgi:hypothetical protein
LSREKVRIDRRAQCLVILLIKYENKDMLYMSFLGLNVVIASGGGWPTTSFHCIRSKTTQSLTFYGILSPTNLLSADTRSAKNRLFLTRNSPGRGARL